jgi:thymidylate synthase (FAD)
MNIEELRAQAQLMRETDNQTKRAVSVGLEEKLYTPISVLDHGFVRVVDYMGNDNAIVQAARVSYGDGTKSLRDDAGLIRYLLRHRHTTPFEMCEIKFHIKLPIFIARQWIRHRTANVNEYSGRYSVMDNDFYLPKPEHLAAQSSVNKQGRGEVLQGEAAQVASDIIERDSKVAYEHYLKLLNGEEGLARELARMILPVNYYTQWYWKIDLHNLLHFLSLRADNHAQYEIRAYAIAMLELVEAWVPVTHQAFMDYRANSVHLSAAAVEVLQRRLRGESVNQEQSGLSKREWLELSAVFEGI